MERRRNASGSRHSDGYCAAQRWNRDLVRIPTLVCMGMAKEQQMREDDQGWSFSDLSVCATCVADYALKDSVRTASTEGAHCSFCGRSPAADLDVLLEAFVRGLRLEHENALEGVSYDGREGGYQFFGDHWDTWDLVDEYADAFANDALVEAVRDHLPDETWVEKDFAWRRRDVVLRDAWSQFRDAVMFRTRYVIWLSHPESDDDLRGVGEVPPAKVLGEVGKLIDELQLVRSVSPSDDWWRAQTHEDRRIAESASRLGTSPRKYAKQGNRMNPAGIPMFYGAVDQVTAVQEVLRHAAETRQRITFGRFRLRREVNVVDFTRLPDEPSLFDPALGQWRRQIRFLRQFVDELTKPVRMEDEHVEYVPTQVLTEYFVRVHGGRENRPPIHGLIYRSSLTGEDAIVLDIDNEHCVEVAAPPAADGGPELYLDAPSVRRIGWRRVRRLARRRKR